MELRRWAGNLLNVQVGVTMKLLRLVARGCSAGAAAALVLMAAPIGFAGSASAQSQQLQPKLPSSAPLAAVNVNSWCADYRRGGPGSDLRAQASDTRRLKLVQADLAPGFDPGARADGLSLLAAYRQELEKRRPDQAAAAIYLAMVSTVPITFGVIEQVNALLCVSSSRGFAQGVAAAAEAERQQMSR